MQFRISLTSRIILAVCCFAIAGNRQAAAQTPLGIRNVTGDVEPAAAAIAANNPWFGAQLAHRFGSDSSNFASDLIAAGQFLYDVPLGATDFHLPIVSNFGGKVGGGSDSTADSIKSAIDSQLKDLLQTSAGITAGVFPYYPVLSRPVAMLTIHGQGSWRYNAMKPYGEQSQSGGEAAVKDAATATSIDVHQVKTGIGVEAVIGDRSAGPALLTFSVTPVMTWFTDPSAYEKAFGTRKSHIGSVELTAVLPLRSEGFGLLLEDVIGPNSTNSFRAGIVLAAQRK